ncbi:putative 1-phosphatidylinositol 3-phosphate 5-kinase [Plutella xylostella]|uniref:putative 1-phosphatidylinositol 3-phosphate 5-kinase n=1 Tax=Plutella xylostella TaxID=51655 RepID=UPI0020321D70|nr:putative 1-phosphatidylinositol 3-phosphate 5-kinase [Plutella xylostella]
MECSTELPHFADYALYKPSPPADYPSEAESEERTRLTESVSSYCLDLNLGESSARLTRTQKTETKPSASPTSEEENPILDEAEGSPEATNINPLLSTLGSEHLVLLARQCLARAGLAAAWLPVLCPLCRRAADTIVPDVFSNDIDIRNYVQVKRLPGGVAGDSRVLPGVVTGKNVAHRGMPQEIANPSILLLDCSIAYQRVEGKLTSLEPVLLQEKEYLLRCAARITALRPKVVLVRGTAARAVQDVLRNEGVALATCVRERALARTARCTGADIATSIDARIVRPRLGTCRSFRVETR